MANGDVEDVIKQLAKAQVEDEEFELSFAGRGLKLNSENDGIDLLYYIFFSQACKSILDH